MRPHKRSAANLKRLTRLLDVTREPERSEGAASQKIGRELEDLTRLLDVTREPERSEGLDGKPLSSAFTQSSVPSPQSCVTARVVECKMFVVLIVRLNGYDGSKPKIPMMFPGCIHGKEKD